MRILEQLPATEEPAEVESRPPRPKTLFACTPLPECTDPTCPRAVAARSASSDVKPQPGPQEQFLGSAADIVVYGGQAGGGKTYAVLMEATRHIDVRGFGAVIFRRTYPQIMNQDGLWDTAAKMYPGLGAVPHKSSSEWVFENGNRIRMAHMQYEDDRLSWDGAQIPLLCFDQLEHFTWRQFWYMLARNRSTCGVQPYIRATCNPDPDHWLRSFMAWWIDEDTGYPIEERSGVVRWFIVQNDEVIWADTKEELEKDYGADCMPKSFTFIRSSVYDNQILLQLNPQYLANLKAMMNVDRERLLEGNWNIRESAGDFFQSQWFEIVDTAPAAAVDTVRYWDRAATKVTGPEGNGGGNGKKGPSWTAGLRMMVDNHGVFYITNVVRFRGTPLDVETAVKNTATQDGRYIRIGIEQDPGQAGKAEAQYQARNLAGWPVVLNAVRESKGTRAKPLSAQVQAGNVKVVRGPWNDAFLRELENFDGTDKCVSDQTDAATGAFYLLTKMQRGGTWGSRR